MSNNVAFRARHGSSGLTIPFGLSTANNRLYEPRQVPLGKACGCICPACKRALYAKHCLAEKVAPHFAHAPGTECAQGLETALHLAAKQLIEERGELCFPALMAHISIQDALGKEHNPCHQLEPAGVRILEHVTSEKSLGDIRPDLLVDAIGLGTVLVEVAVTHFVNQDKLEKVKVAGLPALEIDLSELRQANFGELRRVLFDDPGRAKWIFHPRIAEAQIALVASLKGALDAAADEHARWAVARERLAQEEARRAAQRDELAREQAKELAKEIATLQRIRKEAERQKKHARHVELTKATAFKARPESEKVQILLRRLGLPSLPESTRMRVRGGQSFGIKNPHVWQTTLFGGLIHEQAGNGHLWVKKDFAVGWLKFRFDLTPEFPESEHIAVWDYLTGLADLGALIKRKKGYFNIAVANLRALDTFRALKSNRASLQAGLAWVGEAAWPTPRTAHGIACAYESSDILGREWTILANLPKTIRDRSPEEICKEYWSFNVRWEAILQFLVGAGYLVFSPNSVWPNAAGPALSDVSGLAHRAIHRG